MRTRCTLVLILLLSVSHALDAKTLFKVIEDSFSSLKSYYKNQQRESTKKTIKTMNMQELIEKKDELLASGDKVTAAKFAEKMVTMCNDLTQRGLYMLDLADLHFELGNLKKAELVYKEFAALYPNFKHEGEDKTEYALYKEIVCSYLSILDADRDQTKTKETLELVNLFDERSQGAFKKFDQDVVTIKKECTRRCMDSEINVFNFYLHRGSYRAAHHRLAKIEETYKKMTKELPQVVEIVDELKLALEEKKTKAGITAPLLMPVQEAVKAVEQGTTQVAAAEKKNMVDRF